jgi:hypothetical protein
LLLLLLLLLSMMFVAVVERLFTPSSLESSFWRFIGIQWSDRSFATFSNQKKKPITKFFFFTSNLLVGLWAAASISESAISSLPKVPCLPRRHSKEGVCGVSSISLGPVFLCALDCEESYISKGWMRKRNRMLRGWVYPSVYWVWTDGLCSQGDRKAKILADCYGIGLEECANPSNLRSLHLLASHVLPQGQSTIEDGVLQEMPSRSRRRDADGENKRMCVQ